MYTSIDEAKCLRALRWGSAPALALLLLGAVPACSGEDVPDPVNSADLALKGGMPANGHGKGRTKGAAAGASGMDDSTGTNDAQSDDGGCTVETHGKAAEHMPDTAKKGGGAQSAAEHGKAAEHMPDSAMQGKCNNAHGQGNGKAGQAMGGGSDQAHGKGKGAGGAGDDDAQSDEQG